MKKQDELIKNLEQLSLDINYTNVLKRTFGELSDIESSALIEIIPQCITGDDFDFTRFLSIAARKLDRFTTHVVILDDEVPHYRFGREIYLSWFRGCSFQVRWDGSEWDYGSSDTTLTPDCSIIKSWEKELKPLMAFSHVCQATTKYGEFWSYILKDSSVLNQFMKETGKYDHICRCDNFDFSSILSLVNKENRFDLNTANVIHLAREYYRKSGRVPSHLGVLYYSKDFIAVKDAHDRVLTLPIPKYDENTVHFSEQTYYSTVWYRFSHILLNLSGIAANYQGMRNREHIDLKDATGEYVSNIKDLYERLSSERAVPTAMDILLGASDACNV